MLHGPIRQAPYDDAFLLGRPSLRWLPPAVLALAALFALAPAAISGIRNVYTESFPFMITALGVGLLAPSLGVGFLAVYGLLQLILASPSPGVAAGHLVSLWVLWLLMVEIPLAQRALARTVGARMGGGGAGAVAGTLAGAALTGVLVFLWTQGAPILNRPVFTWAGSNPTAAAVSGLQGHPWGLVVPALLFSLVASVLRLYRGAAPERAAHGPPATPLRRVLTGALVVVGLSGMI
ncbi:MAG TPA: hypothetical protein VNO81_07805, partial [Candidatus Nitrosotenuis sp.]|nr:hypothetical protein [Candidatus Nitrosotenuis sp.]